MEFLVAYILVLLGVYVFWKSEKKADLLTTYIPKQNSVFLTTRLQPLQDHKPFKILKPFQPPRPPKLSLKKLQSKHWKSAPGRGHEYPRRLWLRVCFVWLVWKVALVDAFQLATCKLLIRSEWATPINSACYAGQEICIVTCLQYSCSCNTT